jgi:eukaryotic-like serine/threonine-protein kinase
MNAAPQSQCPRCGSPDSVRAISAGLCPACLITTALSQDDEPCPYRVLAPMSEDATGVTFLAQSLSGTRGYVALKVHDQREELEAVLERYDRWKPVLAHVQHPSIARLIDIGITAEGLLYVASEFIAGWPLSALGSYSLGHDVREMMAHQLGDAIAAAHAAGVAHMALNSAKVKISTANGPRATILGLGTHLIVDGVEPQPAVDLDALRRLRQALLPAS